jgi:hypothetical protein
MVEFEQIHDLPKATRLQLFARVLLVPANSSVLFIVCYFLSLMFADVATCSNQRCLLGRYSLPFTLFDPFLQCADGNAYCSANTDGWQLSGSNQLIDF